MKLSLIKNIFISAIVLSIFAVVQASAQPTQNPVVKNKNFGFSPNPKKKAETVVTPTPKNTVEKPVEISKNVNPSEAVPKPSETETFAIQKVSDEGGEPTNTTTENVENNSTSEKTPEVVNKPKNVSTLPTDIYKIGSSDVLFISLQNAPSKESNYFTVLKDGTIDYPLAGEMVQVAGLTTEQIEELLKEKIKLYENPQVSVKVREHNSHTFTVLGLVERPGEKTLTREALPLFVVRAEAVVQSKANRVSIKRVNSEVQNIDLKDPKYGEVLIFPGDIVEFGVEETSNVSASKSRFYYIGGEIVSGGQKDFYEGITLTQAILASGGLKKSTVKKVVIRRKNEAGLLTPTEFDLKAIKDGKIADPSLQIGDTIEIGN